MIPPKDRPSVYTEDYYRSTGRMSTTAPISPLAWLLIVLTALLLFVVGIRIPVGDAASALAALLVGAIVYKHYRR